MASQITPPSNEVSTKINCEPAPVGMVGVRRPTPNRRTGQRDGVVGCRLREQEREGNARARWREAGEVPARNVFRERWCKGRPSSVHWQHAGRAGNRGDGVALGAGADGAGSPWSPLAPRRIGRTGLTAASTVDRSIPAES